MNTTISVRSLSKSFADEEVLHDVSFEVEPAEFCIVMGPSGCGKSTLLKCIAGIHDHRSGEVYLRGDRADQQPPEERDVGLVFQEFDETLFPHMTVAENIEFGLRQQDREYTDQEVDERIDDLLEMLGMPETRADLPENLSGGQQQRVELARQLARRCDVMLLDDPLGDLDYKLQKYMEIELRRIQNETGSSYLHVTHNQDEGLSLADKLVVLNSGRVEQIGTPTEVYEQPETAFVNRFVGDSTLLVGSPVESGDGRVVVDTGIGEVAATVTGAPVASDQRAVVLVRPEAIDIGRGTAPDGDNVFEGRLERRTFTGDATEFVIAVEGTDGDFLVKEPGLVELGASDGTVTLSWDAADANAYAPADFSVIDSATAEDIASIE